MVWAGRVVTIPWSGLAGLEMIKAGCPLTLLTRFMAMVATIAIGVIIKTEFISLIIIIILTMKNCHHHRRLLWEDKSSLIAV